MAHQLMLHGHPVGYLPPTYASEILYDENTTEKQKIDEIGGVVVSGTLASSVGFSSSIPLPAGMSWNSCVVLSLMINYSSSAWRTGEGINNEGYRLFVSLESTGLRVYNDDSGLFEKEFKVVLRAI